MVVVGLDIGSVAAKGVILTPDKPHRALLPTGWSPRDAGEQLIDQLLCLSGRKAADIEDIVATGYGRASIPAARRVVSEIKCHARGIAAICPEVRTIVDIGGQDSKVIRVDNDGRVVDFAMNDKCAAGTGRFLQVMANALGMDVSELGTAGTHRDPAIINSMCTVFAETEIISLLARGVDKERIIGGIHLSVARRVAAMARRMGVEEKVAFTGGVALNPAVRQALAGELDCELVIPPNCQFTGALGAALLARDQLVVS